MNTDSCNHRFNPPRHISRLRFYFRIFFALVFLIILAIWLDYWLRGEMGIAHKFNELMQGRWTTGILIGGGILYVLLLSLPFVPGVELGVLLMCVFGKEGIVFVYFATVAGLSLAFLLGRLLPKDWAESRLQKLGFSRDRDNPDDGIEGMLDTLTRNSRFRQSLRLLIDGSPGYSCVGGWVTVEQALRAPELSTADVLLLDTAGRLHVDEALMAEMKAVSQVSAPTEVLLVVDSLTGQDAVNLAKSFDERLDVLMFETPGFNALFLVAVVLLEQNLVEVFLSDCNQRQEQQ